MLTYFLFWIFVSPYLLFKVFITLPTESSGGVPCHARCDVTLSAVSTLTLCKQRYNHSQAVAITTGSSHLSFQIRGHFFLKLWSWPRFLRSVSGDEFANVYADRAAHLLGVYEHTVRVDRKLSSFCLVCCAWGLMEAAEWTESCQSCCAALDLFYECPRSAGWDWFTLCNIPKFF